MERGGFKGKWMISLILWVCIMGGCRNAEQSNRESSRPELLSTEQTSAEPNPSDTEQENPESSDGERSDSESPNASASILQPYDDVRVPFSELSVSQLDLSAFGEDMLTLIFNEKTVFPSRDKMPDQDELQPDFLMEAGRNPGLGIRALHGQGITGSGVTAAIIDQPLYIDSHPEYQGKIIAYKDFGCQSEVSMHGPAVTSLLVGETIGTAPGARVYYAAVPSWLGDASYYAEALDWIIETNANLPEGEKIRMVSISASPTPSDERFVNGEQYLACVKRAQEAGILIIDCSPENGFVGSCGYDFYSPEEVALCKPVDLTGQYPFRIDPDILVPVTCRTLAEEYEKGDYSYQYDGMGGWSWAAPYAAGVLAMGFEVRPELTAVAMKQILLDTAYVDSDGNRYVNPDGFIDYLRNV